MNDASYPGSGFGLNDVAIQANPFPAYEWLRENAPVYRADDMPMWVVVSRHEDIEAILRDPVTFSSDLGISVPLMSMVMRDAPDHSRLRQTVNRAFTPRNIRHLEARITEIARSLLAAAPRQVEFVQAYANLLSVTVICEMLGVPLDRREEMNRFARDALVASFAAVGMGSAELFAEVQTGLASLMEILDQAIEQHLRAPQDNIISALVAEEANGVLSRDELRNLCALLLIGGHETTSNLIASGAYILAETPALWRELKTAPEKIPKFVEELVRLRAPLQRIARRTTREATIAGTTLPADTLLRLFPGSANLDPRRWPDPRKLDLARDARSHLGFGTGIHACPGAPLARLEGRIAFQVLLQESESIALDPAHRAVPIAGYAAGGLGWRILPLIRTPAAGGRAMPSPDDVFEPVCGIVADSLGLDRGDIDAATCAKNTPEWDSLAHLMILDAIEKAFRVKLPRLAAYRVKDVGELVQLVAAETGRPGG
ncbi:MAG TPA: cytochrome P450 [Stellaceae bacterium]|jgi:cytochrome P450/acyl carrier protein